MEASFLFVVCVSFVAIMAFTATTFYSFGKKVGKGTPRPQKEVPDGDYDIIGYDVIGTLLGYIANTINKNGEYIIIMLYTRPKFRRLRFKDGEVTYLA